MNEYQTRDYNNKLLVLDGLNACKGYQFTAETPNSEGQFSIRLEKGAPIYVSYWDYRKDYAFYLDHKLQYITHDTIKDIAQELKNVTGLETPNNMHKPNARAIAKWVEYYTAIYERAKVVSAERVAKITAFVDEFLKAGGRINNQSICTGSRAGEMSGGIVRNGIEYTMQVYDNAYIHQDIKTHYTIKNSLECFKQLADNKFTAEA